MQQQRLSAQQLRSKRELLAELSAKNDKARRKAEERRLQKMVVQHFIRRKKCAHYICHHSPNGGKRDAREGAHFKQMATLPGFPDLIFLADTRSHFLELKWGDGTLSDTQIAMHQTLKDNGFDVAVVNNLDDAIAQMIAWGLIA